MRPLLPLLLGAAIAGLVACSNTTNITSDVVDAVDGSTDTGPPPDACIGAPVSPQCPLCAPFATSCSGDALSVLQCSSDGLSSNTMAACPAGQLCTVANGSARCVDPCPNAAAEHSYQGCEFFAANTINAQLGHAYAGQSRDEFPFEIVATNSWPVPAVVTVSGAGLAGTLQATVPPNDAVEITLPWILDLAEGADPLDETTRFVPGGAAHITSTLPVAVYQFNPINYFAYHECEGPQCFSYTNDASLLLPVASIADVGTSYMVLTLPTARGFLRNSTAWATASGFVTIVGTSATPANVSVLLHGNSEGGPDTAPGVAGMTLTRQLAQGDVWQIVSQNDSACAEPEMDTLGDEFCVPVAAEDLTGSVVTSDVPIAVFSGHDCAFVPYDRAGCDHMEEQIYPTTTLGAEYIVAPTAAPSTNPASPSPPNVIEIVATQPNTTLTLTPPVAGAQTTLANVGDSMSFTQTDVVRIDSSSPVLVGQLLVGGEYAQMPGTVIPDGDPDLVLGVPAGQWRNAYEFYASRLFDRSVSVFVVAHGGPPVYLDGVAITNRAPDRTLGSSYDVYYVADLVGAHAASSTNAFSLVVSGIEVYTSYTYAAGLDLIASPPSP